VRLIVAAGALVFLVWGVYVLALVLASR